MITLSPSLATHIAGEVTTLCTCWKLTKKDTTIIGFTDHTADLIIDGITYYSAPGYTPTAVNFNTNLQITNLDISGLLLTSYITREDILYGVYDYAEVEIFLINYTDLTGGIRKLKRGWLGEIILNNDSYTVDMMSMVSALHTSSICDIYSPSCRAVLGDTNCGVNISSYTVSGTISGVVSSTLYNINVSGSYADNYFNYGLLTCISGANVGESIEIKDWTQVSGVISVYLPLPYTVSVGDVFTLIPGCDKLHTTCYSKFNNIANFRGEPFLPGTASLIEYAVGSRSYATTTA